MKTDQNIFDVIVVGAGHAGCEAALAAARQGVSTLILTINMDHIAQMSCNPAIGGIAKGQVVREIDALGGAMGRVTDAASIQFRMLNSTKGPAVWSPRSQCDKLCYQRAMKLELEKHDNLEIKQAMVTDFIVEDDAIVGIETEFDDKFYCKSLVITTGTFLSGKLHYGMINQPGGRAGDPASVKLAESLRNKLNLRIGRLKTGTPPRILAKTIDFSVMHQQEAECCDEYFSYFPNDKASPTAERKDMPCYLVYTTNETAEVVKNNIDKSPLYQGEIEGIGTRYCPSFEDKVVRFPHHERHLLYLEPEGEYTEEYYINGFSTSLPPQIQVEMINSIPGMENAQISRYAYAIEYDFVFPDQLERSLRVKKWRNLFLAGQINGTSGYEEAGGQGLVAGLNAGRIAQEKETVEIARDMSYIGVMIDDLVTKDITEPYRLFTSRAEYRLRLRQDNSDIRLCEFAYKNGILPEEKYQQYKVYNEMVTSLLKVAKKEKHEGKTLWELIKTSHGKFNGQLPFPSEKLNIELENSLARRAIKQLVISAHYEGYLLREKKSIKKLHRLEDWNIPEDFDYESIKGLRNESRIKLMKFSPTTLSQASRIDGVTPAEIALLQVHLTRLKKSNSNKEK